MANQRNENRNQSQDYNDLKVPPHDINAEAAVLSAALIDSWAVSIMLELLEEEYFYKNAHRLIFRAIKILFNSDVEIDLITIIDELKKEGHLEDVGGTPYLSDISEIVATSSNIEAHCKIVLEKGILRKLIKVSRGITEKCHNSEQDSSDIIEYSEKSIFDVTQNLRHEGFELVSNYVNETIKDIEKIASRKSGVVGIASGFAELDEKTGGFHPGQFIVIAARPSMGKTSLAMNMAFHTAMHQRKSVGIFSLEMDKEKLLMRMLSSAAEVSLSEMLHGFNINQEKIFRITTVGDELTGTSLYIDDRGSNTISDMRSKARRLKAEEGLDMLVIDYMQLMVPIRTRNSRTQEMTEISRSIKIMAKELEIPIIAISQLSRAPEVRKNKRPVLADLRESGAIEQDADLVIMLYRDDYYNEDSDEPGVAEVNISKNRNGPQGKVKMEFLGEYTLFKPLR